MDEVVWAEWEAAEWPWGIGNPDTVSKENFIGETYTAMLEAAGYGHIFKGELE